MKRILTVVAALVFAMCISTSAFAHSNFGGPNPADGEVVTETLNEIVLEFNGQIEQGSFIDITTAEGHKLELEEIIVGEGTLTGKIDEPLPNDEYQVNWSIISADGHPLEGNFSFTVDVDVTDETVEDGTEEPTDVIETEETREPAQQPTENQESYEVKEESSSMTIPLIILLVVIVLGGIFVLSKRRK